MAITISQAELSAALRLGTTAEENAEVTRLLAYATTAVIKHAPAAPDTAHNEAVILVSGYLFDKPTASRGASYANAMRNSGAGAVLLPYREIRGVNSADADPTTGTPGTGVDEQAVRDLVADWAEADNASQIPANKLESAPGGGGNGPVFVEQVLLSQTDDVELTDPIPEGKNWLIVGLDGFDHFERFRLNPDVGIRANIPIYTAVSATRIAHYTLNLFWDHNDRTISEIQGLRTTVLIPSMTIDENEIRISFSTDFYVE